MSELKRREGSQIPKAIDDPKAKALFDKGMQPLPEGRALVIIASDACGHCHNSLQNNDYPEQTSNGTPVIWLNYTYEETFNRMFHGIPGLAFDEQDRRLEVNGVPIRQFPTAIEVVNGQAKQVVTETLFGAGNPEQAYNLQPAGSFDRVAEKLALDAAREQALKAVRNPETSGTTVPQKPDKQQQAGIGGR